MCIIYSLYSKFSYRKVYSPTLPPLGSWAQMAVGSGRWRTSWSRDCGSEVSGVCPPDNHNIVVQDELQNHCRSRETCSFGTPDAVVCKAARSASAVLAAVGRSVGIGARAGAGFGLVRVVFLGVQGYADSSGTAGEAAGRAWGRVDGGTDESGI